MKHFTLTSRTLLGLALMGAFSVAPTLASRAEAQTQPELRTRLTDAGDRFDNNDDATDNDDDGPRNRRDHDGRGPGARRGGDRSVDGRRDKGRDFGERRGRGFGGRQNMSREFGGRGGDFGGRENRGGNRPGGVAAVVAPKFVGVVTKVKNNSEFDVRIDDKTYNVYLSAPSAPVSVGQTVNLDGERIGNNDIRSASLLQPRRR